MALATSIIAALVGAAGAATAAGISAAGANSAAKKNAEAAKAAARNSSTEGKAPLTSAQLLAGNPNVLSSNTADNASLSGRGRLLGN